MLNRLRAVFTIGIVALTTPGPHAQAVAPSDCVRSSGPANLGFTLKDLDGKEVRLSTYLGHVLVVNFWATWCEPCKLEIPGFIDLYNRYRDRGLAVVGIAMDEPVATVTPYTREMKMNYPVLVSQGREDLEEAFGLTGLPTTFIINRDGTVCRRYHGYTRKETFEDALKRLVGAT